MAFQAGKVVGSPKALGVSEVTICTRVHCSGAAAKTALGPAVPAIHVLPQIVAAEIEGVAIAIPHGRPRHGTGDDAGNHHNGIAPTRLCADVMINPSPCAPEGVREPSGWADLGNHSVVVITVDTGISIHVAKVDLDDLPLARCVRGGRLDLGRTRLRHPTVESGCHVLNFQRMMRPQALIAVDGLGESWRGAER